MVAVLDDVHVADPSSLLLLQFLVRSSRPHGTWSSWPPTAKASTTVEGFTDVVAQLLRERSTTRLRLGGLDEAGVAEMVGAAMGAGPSPRLVCACP